MAEVHEPISPNVARLRAPAYASTSLLCWEAGLGKGFFLKYLSVLFAPQPPPLAVSAGYRPVPADAFRP